MLGLEKLEIALNDKSTMQNLQTTDRALINHMESARSITIQLDKTALGLAYHVHAMKPCLEGNTLGFPTDFVKFAEQKLGIKKAQAYNLDTVGESVRRVPDTEIYLDKWTYENLLEDCTTNGATDWEMMKKLARSRKTLVSTKVLTVCRLLNKYDFNDEDVRAFIADKNNHAYTCTVKEFEKLLKEPFNALPDTKKVESNATEGAEKDAENSTENSTENSAEKAKKDAEAFMNETAPIHISALVKAFNKLEKLVDEYPEIAPLVNEIAGNEIVADWVKKADKAIKEAEKIKTE